MQAIKKRKTATVKTLFVSDRVKGRRWRASGFPTIGSINSIKHKTHKREMCFKRDGREKCNCSTRSWERTWNSGGGDLRPQRKRQTLKITEIARRRASSSHRDWVSFLYKERSVMRRSKQKRVWIKLQGHRLPPPPPPRSNRGNAKTW